MKILISRRYIGKISFCCLVMVFIALFYLHTITAQQKVRQAKALPLRLMSVQEKPSLGVEYASVADLKIASRKTKYQVGEIASVDFAVLSTSNKPFFMSRISPGDLIFTVKDENGVLANLFYDYVVVKGDMLTNYVLLDDTNRLVTGSFQLHIGCADKARKHFQNSRMEIEKLAATRPSEVDKLLFSRDLFVTWGDACLPLKGSRQYTLSAKVENEAVVLTSGKRPLKTAVGTLQSNSLSLEIVL